MQATPEFRVPCLFLFTILSYLFIATAVSSGELIISGNITVPSLKEQISLPKNSYLIVKFEDVSWADAPSILLGKQAQMIREGTRLGPDTEPLHYRIVCNKKDMGDIVMVDTAVSAVIYVGREQQIYGGIRIGDFFTDTMHSVDLYNKFHLSSGNGEEVEDIHIVRNIEIRQYIE